MVQTFSCNDGVATPNESRSESNVYRIVQDPIEKLSRLLLLGVAGKLDLTRIQQSYVAFAFAFRFKVADE